MNKNNLLCRRTGSGIFLMAGLMLLSFGNKAYSQVNELRSAPLTPIQMTIQPAANESWPKTNTLVSTTEMEAASPRESVSANTLSGKQALPDLSALLWQLSTSTAFVLCLVVVGLVVFKKFRLDEKFSGNRRATNGHGPEIRVEAVLRLKGNRVFEIVRADSARLIVVSDSNGIQSVLPITTGFLEQMQSCDMDQVVADLDRSSQDQQPETRSIRKRTSLSQFGQRT